MGFNRDTNRNFNASVKDRQTIGNDLANVIAVANTERMFLGVQFEDFGGWIRYVSAATEASVRKGFRIPKNCLWEMPPDNMYIGEVSIINLSDGETPSIYITEY